MESIKGKAWKFGDDINTDVIAPGRYMDKPVEEMRRHVLETVNSGFATEVKEGDTMVCGHNFGCGSSREEAPAVLKACGIKAVVAESFARIFFRNAIAIGLPVAICPGVSDAFGEGDTLELDLDSSSVANVNTGTVLLCEKLPDEVKMILAGGGILPVLREIGSGQPRDSGV